MIITLSLPLLFIEHIYKSVKYGVHTLSEYMTLVAVQSALLLFGRSDCTDHESWVHGVSEELDVVEFPRSEIRSELESFFYC